MRSLESDFCLITNFYKCDTLFNSKFNMEFHLTLPLEFAFHLPVQTKLSNPFIGPILLRRNFLRCWKYNVHQKRNGWTLTQFARKFENILFGLVVFFFVQAISSLYKQSIQKIQANNFVQAKHKKVLHKYLIGICS